MIFLNYPSNPTGGSYRKKELEAISEFAVRKNLLVISDEIYGELSYDQEHIPISTLPGMKERTLLLGGLSKTYAMTGWRVGFAAGPADWISAMLKIHQYSMLCAPTTSQIAAEAAIKYCQSDAQMMKETYQIRRDFIVSAFNEMGYPTLSPEGAFYVFPDISSSGLKSFEFAEKLLERNSVAVVPGTAFGTEGEGFIRCSYATNIDNLEKAMMEIRSFSENLKKEYI
jgi:aminotransferase